LRNEDEYGFVDRAEREEFNHKQIVLVRFQGVQGYTGDGAAAGSQRIVVQPRTRSWLLGSSAVEPKQLRPGVYSVANLLIGGNKPGAAGKGHRVYDYSVMCSVSDLPVVATFVLPDLQTFVESGSISRALQSLNLRTSDNQLGAARGQISLIVRDPVRLIKTFGDAQIRRGKVDAEVLAGPSKAGLFRRLFNWIKGNQEPDEQFFAAIPPFTVADLYERIGLELARSVQTSIGKQTVTSLYEDIRVRDEVQQDMCRDLHDTMAAYGLEIERVSAFQFACPEYEALLKRKGAASLDAEALSEDRRELDTKDQRRALKQADAKTQKSVDGELQRHAITEDEQTKLTADEAAKQDQLRKLGRETDRRSHERTQREADEKLRIGLERDKLQLALDMHNQLKDAEQRRKLEEMHEYAKLPPAQVLQIAMIQNPHLVEAFKAAQGADGTQQQITMLNQFREQLVKVYGENRDQIQQLMLAAVRQIGAVYGKRADDLQVQRLPSPGTAVQAPGTVSVSVTPSATPPPGRSPSNEQK
jgi:hypothetical protein